MKNIKIFAVFSINLLCKRTFPLLINVQYISVTQSCLTLCDPMDYSTPNLPIHHQLPEFTKLMSIESLMPSNQLILCHLFLFLPSIIPSIRVFSNESVLRIRWLKYWSFSFSISPSNEYSGLISFRMDWLDLLAVQGTLKSLLQHHSSKASILRHSAFFIVQLSHLYMTTGKITALTRQTFVFLCILWFSYCTVQSIKTEQDLVWVLLGTEAPLWSPFLICRKRL